MTCRPRSWRCCGKGGSTPDALACPTYIDSSGAIPPISKTALDRHVGVRFGTAGLARG
jgi:hypothetical protein